MSAWQSWGQKLYHLKENIHPDKVIRLSDSWWAILHHLEHKETSKGAGPVIEGLSFTENGQGTPVETPEVTKTISKKKKNKKNQKSEDDRNLLLPEKKIQDAERNTIEVKADVENFPDTEYQVDNSVTSFLEESGPRQSWLWLYSDWSDIYW